MFHDPFEGGFAVDDLDVGFFGDVADGESGEEIFGFSLHCNGRV